MDNLNFDELITAVISEVAEAHEISVYPNPASDQLILSMESSPGKMVNLSVFDVLGRMILTQNIPDPAGMTTLDISTLPAGNYLLRITADHRTALERKIIVLR